MLQIVKSLMKTLEASLTIVKVFIIQDMVVSVEKISSLALEANKLERLSLASLSILVEGHKPTLR
jgi:hypothetical protein